MVLLKILCVTVSFFVDINGVSLKKYKTKFLNDTTQFDRKYNYTISIIMLGLERGFANDSVRVIMKTAV